MNRIFLMQIARQAGAQVPFMRTPQAIADM